MKILLVEDDESLAGMLMQHLKMQHYSVDLATDGQAGWEMATAFNYDLMLLDVMLPVLDGISFCQQWRTAGDLTPILLLTALDLSTSKVTGLDAGADDYVVKPFNPDELLARIRALLRRGHPVSLPVMQWGNVQLDPSSCQVTCDGQPIHLTSKEYELLELFLRNPHRVFSSSILIDRLWSFDELPTESTVRTHIKGLRRKLAKAGSEDMIETIYGLGYRLRREKHENSLEIETIDQTVPAREEINHAIEIQLTRSSSYFDSFPSSSSVASVPSFPSFPSAASASASPQLAALWQIHQEKYFDRIRILEQAIATLHSEPVSEQLRQQAQQQAQHQAHTLAGALGSFGFNTGSQLSRQIEHTLKAHTTMHSSQMQQLAAWVKQLWQALLQPPGGAIDRPLHLLIVDHNLELATALAAEANEGKMLATIATQLQRARAIINQVLPDVIVLNLNFPPSSNDQLDFWAELSTVRPSIPTIVLITPEDLNSLPEMSNQGIELAHRKQQQLLQKPVSFTQIMAATKQLVSAPLGSIAVGHEEQ